MRKNILITTDCGFVPCMFPEQNDVLMQEQFRDMGKRCNPVLDILPDGHVISCFPLNHVTGKIKPGEYANAQEIREIFLRKLDPFKSTGIFPQCIKSLSGIIQNMAV